MNESQQLIELLAGAAALILFLWSAVVLLVTWRFNLAMKQLDAERQELERLRAGLAAKKREENLP